MAALEDQGIATRPGTHAPPELGVYGRRAEEFPNAHRAARESLALPLYAGLTDAEQDLVVAALRGERRALRGRDRGPRGSIGHFVGLQVDK